MSAEIVKSLEAKARELEQANHALRAELESRIQAEARLLRLLEEAERTRQALRDIVDDQRRVQESLRESEERLRTVVENIDELVWVAEPGHIESTYLSPVFEKIWGRPPSSVDGQPDLLLQTVVEADRPLFLEAVAKEAAGLATSLEYRITRPDGSVRWVWDRGIPVFDASGRVVRINGITMDITERKLAEQQLQEQLDELRRWQRIMLKSSDRSQELKREVNELLRRLGEPMRYPSQAQLASG